MITYSYRAGISADCFVEAHPGYITIGNISDGYASIRTLEEADTLIAVLQKLRRDMGPPTIKGDG